MKKILNSIDARIFYIPLALSIFLLFCLQISFLLFHTLVEFFAIIVAVLTTVVGWQMYTYTRNHFLMYLGCGYFWVASIDMLHSLTYKGMSIFPMSGANISIEYWLIARYMEAFLLLTAPWFLSHALKRNIAFPMYGIAASILVFIIYNGHFPDAFIEGKGLTEFKIYSEYMIICVLAMAAIYLTRLRQLMDSRVYILMISSIGFTMLAELFFTFYISVYGISIIIGHFFKLFSYWLIFIAVIRTTLSEPFSALSKAETHYDAVPDAVIIVDDSGFIMHVNSEACKMAGQQAVDLTGRQSHDIYHASSVIPKDCPICQAIKNHKKLSCYEININDDIWMDFSISEISDEHSYIELIRDITDRKNTEISLSDSESSLARTEEIAHVGSWEYDLLSKEIKYSDETCRMFGFKPKSFRVNYSSFIEIISHEDRDMVSNIYKKSLTNSEQGHEIEYRIVHALTGDIRVISEKSIYKKNSMGIITRHIGMVHDVTERKKMRETIASSTRHIKLYRDQSVLGVIGWDLNCCIVDFNHAAENMFGYTLKEIQGLNILEFLSPENETIDIESFWETLISNKGNSEKTIKNKTKTGTLISCKWYCSVIKDDAGELIGATAIILDVTSELQALRALSKKEYEQRKILDCMVDPVITIDEDGIIHSFNKAAEKLFGYTSFEIMGLNVKQLMPAFMAKQHDEYLHNYIHTGIAKVIGIGREVEGQRKDNSCFPMRLSVAELPKLISGKRYFIGSCVDLTLFNQQQEQLRRSQKMDALGKLTGGIAHDFNNMLGIITGYAELLTFSLNDRPELASFAKEIHHAGLRGAKLTKKLLGFSRLKSSETTKVNLSNSLNNQQHMLEKTLTARIRLELLLDNKLWDIWIDHDNFEDAVLNMCINAMHAIEGNGEISISTFNTSLSSQDATILGLNQGDYITFSISDTGCGMTDTIKDKIFDPFFSTKGEKGTGLGLSQVYGFIKSSKGAVKVYSETDKGSQFIFYFPRYIEKNTKQNIQKTEHAVDLTGNESILVVDDEKPLRILASKILGKKGYNVFSAESALQALAILEKEHIDLLFSDVIMPDMDGYSLATIVQKKYPHIKIQLNSGFSADYHLEAEDENLHHNLIYKPYNSSLLLKRFRELLDD